MTPQQKSWATRRANGNAPTAKSGQSADVRNPDIDLVMTIGVSESDGLAQVTCAFGFLHHGKPAAESAISMDDRALLNIRLISGLTQPNGNAEFVGHDTVRVSLPDACANELAAILPRMQALDSVLTATFKDSEDSSFPMALQAIAWNLRVNWIEFEGKRSKRGIAYAIGEQIAESVLSLYRDKSITA